MVFKQWLGIVAALIAIVLSPIGFAQPREQKEGH
jgi:hypothetical protein